MASNASSTGRRRPENAAWYMALIVILIAGMVIWAVLSLRIDPLSDAMKDDDIIAILIVIDDEKEPLLTEVLLYHPVSRNSALINVPFETGMLLSSVDRVDRLVTIYDGEEIGAYKEAVGQLLGRPLDFYLRLDKDSFEKAVDIIGGIDVFVPNAVNDTIEGARYLFPPGSVSMDGAKALSFLEYSPDGELPEERSEREQRVTKSLLRRMGESVDLLSSEEVSPFFLPLFEGNLDQKGLVALMNELSLINADRIVFQGILGNRRNLDGKSVLFPYYDGKLIKETVQRVEETLARTDDFGGDLLTVRVEILNGTSVNGLASRTAQIYQSYGFRIASVTNAERSDYDRTVVLDRRGNPDAARRAAELIRCEQIHSRIEGSRDETVDVTVILGNDFDGRYVKK